MPKIFLQILPGRETTDRGLALMEQILAALHGLPNLQLTLTIQQRNGLVGFGASADDAVTQLLERYVYANYPAAQVRRLPPPEVIGSVRTRHLALRRPGVFPIKRHPEFVDSATKEPIDPLDVLASALAASAGSAEWTAIEIALAPLSDRYRKRATKALMHIQAREFQRAERHADAFLKLSLLPLAWRLCVWPLRAWRKRHIPFPEEVAASSQANDEGSRSHDRESDFQACLQKVRKQLFTTTVTLKAAVYPNHPIGNDPLDAVAAAFGQFALPGLNGFRTSRRPRTAILSTEEVASIYHLPRTAAATADIDAATSAVLPPPRELPPIEPGRYAATIGETTFRDERRPFALPIEARQRHLWVTGKSGSGKSTLLENLILQDIAAGLAVGVVDPHGDLVQSILKRIPPARTNDVILIDPADTDFPVAFNPLDCPRDKAALVADGVVATFYKLFGEIEHGTWGPRLESILVHCVLALTLAGGATLLDVLKLLDPDPGFRISVLRRVRDPLVLHWWQHDFPPLLQNRRDDPFASVKNKLRQMLATPVVRNIVGQPRSRLDFRQAIDSRKIVLCDLAQGKLGQKTSGFLGSLIVTQFQLAAMSRANVPEAKRADFMLYVDECQTFATESFPELLAQGRKFKCNLTLANQFIGQLSQSLTAAIMGNVGAIAALQVGAEDAEILARQLGEPLRPEDLIDLPRYCGYVRTEVEGKASAPFSIALLPPAQIEPDRHRAAAIRTLSRQRYATDRRAVERAVERSFGRMRRDADRTDGISPAKLPEQSSTYSSTRRARP